MNSTFISLQRRLFEIGGWFDQTFEKKLAGRRLTFRSALSIYAQLGGSVIVETGCLRVVDDWTAGCSTKIFGLFLKEMNAGRLFSVDKSAEYLNVARQVVKQDGTSDCIDFHLSDSVDYLRDFGNSIDLLYLDSFDYSPTEPGLSLCQIHQRKEIEAAYNKLSGHAVVLLDDNELPHGGKTRLSKEYLAEQNWLCILDWQQSLWIRSK